MCITHMLVMFGADHVFFVCNRTFVTFQYCIEWDVKQDKNRHDTIDLME